MDWRLKAPPLRKEAQPCSPRRYIFRQPEEADEPIQGGGDRRGGFVLRGLKTGLGVAPENTATCRMRV